MKRNDKALSCYPAGNGCLMFGWIKNGKATGDIVTDGDVKQYMKRKEGIRLSDLGYKVMRLPCSPYPVLVTPPKRIDSETLEIKGSLYAYQMDKSKVNDDGFIPQHAIKVLCDGEECFHIATITQVALFLNYEEKIVAQS